MDIGMYNSYLEVDFGRMKESFRKVQAAAGRRGVIPVLKANAYGMNAVEVAGALKTEGARLFAVASSDEAEQLLRELPDIEVLVMGMMGEGALRRLIAKNMPVTLFSEAQGEVVDVSGKLPKSYVLTEEFGLRRVYLTQYNATIMEKRAEAPSGIVDGG